MLAPEIHCPVDYTLTLLSGKWKLLALHQLQAGARRFTELERELPAISPRMLTQVLRELEAYGLVQRTVHSAVPPKVEYALTAAGRTVEPLIGALRDWGTQHRHAAEQG
jgi:DNA-binding HxlR family transcriptional regulator